jgi:hypothetical protein
MTHVACTASDNQAAADARTVAMLGDAPVVESGVKSGENAGSVAPASVRFVAAPLTSFGPVMLYAMYDTVAAIALAGVKRCGTGEHAAVGGAGTAKQEEHTSVTGATGKLGIDGTVPVNIGAARMMEALLASPGKPVRLMRPSLPSTPQRMPVAVENMAGADGGGPFVEYDHSTLTPRCSSPVTAVLLASEALMASVMSSGVTPAVCDSMYVTVEAPVRLPEPAGHAVITAVTPTGGGLGGLGGGAGGAGGGSVLHVAAQAWLVVDAVASTTVLPDASRNSEPSAMVPVGLHVHVMAAVQAVSTTGAPAVEEVPEAHRPDAGCTRLFPTPHCHICVLLVATALDVPHAVRTTGVPAISAPPCVSRQERVLPPAACQMSGKEPTGAVPHHALLTPTQPLLLQQ